MSIISKLMDSSAADIEVLRSLDSNGDDFSKFREVDFLLRCPDYDKAQLVAGFINDYHFGHAVANDDYTIQVLINMPVQQHIITPVTGFMLCLAELYDLEFDGWGCIAQSQQAQ